MSRIGIIAALPDEAKCLYQDKLNLSEPVEIQKDIFLCLSGVGEKSAVSATQSLLMHDIDGLISWGVAGAIDPKLNIGDILISDTVFYRNNKYTSSLSWLNNLAQEIQKRLSHVKTGMIVSTTEISSTIEIKNSLFKNTGAIAVDMESGAISEIAHSKNIDFIVLRSISDDAKTLIPNVVLNYTDHLGRPDLFPFLFSCVKQPNQIITLIKLAKCYKKALLSLEQIASDLKKHHFHYNT